MKNFNYPELMILGSTGSVGTQAIDVAMRENIPVLALSADRNAKLIEEQARALGVRACAMNDVLAANDLKARLADTNIKVYAGREGICQMIEPRLQRLWSSVPFSAGQSSLFLCRCISTGNPRCLVLSSRLCLPVRMWN